MTTSKRIKVLHPITRLIVGGAQENTMYTAALLDKERYDIEVLSGPQTGSEGSLIEEVRQLGVPLTILPELVREVSPWNDVLALWKLYKHIRSGAYTIVHTHSSKAGILGRIAAQLARTPVIVHTIHGWSFHEHMSPFRRSAYILLERMAASFSNALIVVAESDIEKGQQSGIGTREQYHLIRSAIPLDTFDPERVDSDQVRQELGIPLDAPVLGNVGRFSPQKNPMDWVRVAGKVGRTQPNAWFLLVGDGPLREQVETALEEEDIRDRTILTGLRRDVPRLMSAMDVFLLTSLWEGLPRVIPQAMAMRKPVVVNRANGTQEAIQNEVTGYLVDQGDLIKMAEQCLKLLSNDELREHMGHAARSFTLQHFDLNQMVKQIASIYEALILKHQAR